MQSIRLNSNEWEFDEGDRLGPAGGFGEVFRGRGTSGDVAVKRLLLSATSAAHRELDIGEHLKNKNLMHVVPVFDSGQDANSDRYYIVMPICKNSLQDILNKKESLDQKNCLKIMSEIVTGLLEVKDLVHRDLKPGNVLMWENRWRLADFGIAKFVEDSTSLQTLRGSLTPAYGAPEQWKLERPTHATDVYAAGCILYALFHNKHPFVGDVEDIREQHLHAMPPPLDTESTRLNAFFKQMLRKTSSARPNRERCLEVFQSILASETGRWVNVYLQAAAGAAASASAVRETDEAKALEYRQQREALAAEALADLREIQINLCGRIREVAEPEAGFVTINSRDGSEGVSVTLESGTLKIEKAGPTEVEYYPGKDMKDEWDICACATISVRCLPPKTISRPMSFEMQSIASVYGQESYVFSASLVFCSIPTNRDFRWREIGFFSVGTHMDAPIALTPGKSYFLQAIGPIVSNYEIAYGPLAIDGEDTESFIDRWLTLFGKAAQGKLQRPNRLPIPETYFM